MFHHFWLKSLQLKSITEENQELKIVYNCSIITVKFEKLKLVYSCSRILQSKKGITEVKSFTVVWSGFVRVDCTVLGHIVVPVTFIAVQKDKV